MIGKIKITSSGYDPNGPPVSDPTLGPGPVPPEVQAAAELEWAVEHLRGDDCEVETYTVNGNPQKQISIKRYRAALILARAYLAEHPKDPTPAEPRLGDWSFIRNVLARGAAIQQDYAAGNHGSYEAYSARLDAAARELADMLKPAATEPEATTE